MAAKILLVEDEATIARALVDLLTGQGYEVEHCATGDAGQERGLAGGHAVALLDVMLPGVDGFSLCRSLREAHPRIGICMLTAKGGEGDILEGFRAGADDYIPKPFSIAQLLARVEALVRRVGASEAAFHVGGFRVDPARLRAEHGERACDLVRRDVELLAVLARADGAVVPRSVLLGEVWGYARPDAVESRCVDMHVVKLRRRLADAFGSLGERLVETVRGEGYRFRVGED